MKWSPHVEGEFVCSHLAANLADLVLVLTRHKKFYKTSMVHVGKNCHNSTLFVYYSCKGCFDEIHSASIRHEHQEIGEPGNYKITGNIINYNQSHQMYQNIISGADRYLATRRKINDDIGSGYSFDRQKALTIWDDACMIAFEDYMGGRVGDLFARWDKWKKQQGKTNTQEKTRITRLAKAKLAKAIEIIDTEGMPHLAFDQYVYFFDKIGKVCDMCFVVFSQRGTTCRFCRGLTQTEINRLKRLENRIKKGFNRLKHDDTDKKDSISKRIEDEGRQVVISEMIEERGTNETFSELKEMYGYRTARELTGADTDEYDEGLSEAERNET